MYINCLNCKSVSVFSYKSGHSDTVTLDYIEKAFYIRYDMLKWLINSGGAGSLEVCNSKIILNFQF